MAKFSMDTTEDKNEAKIALLGNPNVGKSVIFGCLTGRYTSVSNYPGTTVEVARGTSIVGRRKVTLIDTPGINTLVPMSEDEEVTRNILLEERIDSIIQVADAKNLRRALLISLQLIEMEMPFVLDLNMEDEAASMGVTIDKNELSSIIDTPIVGTVAIQKRGIKELQKSASSERKSKYRLRYSEDIEAAVAQIENLLPESNISPRSIALMLLSRDQTLVEWLHQKLSDETIDQIEKICNDLERYNTESLAYRINRQRLRAVDTLLTTVMKKESPARQGWATWLGQLCMHPIWGLGVLLVVLFLFYEFVGNFGAQIAVDWLENGLFGNYLNPLSAKLFSKIFFFSPFLQDFFVGPYGMITMALTYALAIIFPIVVTFFIAFSLIEDSGYLPRLAIMLNRIFKSIGLNGKAVVPMVLGLGCDTMATMSARIMDTRKERIILTLLLALGVPCSAQLGIILGMLGTMPFWVTILWFGVVIGIILSVGFLSARILPGHQSDFMMEIPPIRKPTLFNIISKTIARLEWYMKEVVPLFILGTLILFSLDKMNLLPAIQKLANPLVVHFLNLPPEGTEAFLIGFLRRDYGATRFFDMYTNGQLDVIQAAVSLVVMTLFVPCLANALMIIKERGLKIAIAIVAFIYPLAFFVGGVVNWGLRL
jgi:ferrous iron transport protein B